MPILGRGRGRHLHHHQPRAGGQLVREGLLGREAQLVLHLREEARHEASTLHSTLQVESWLCRTRGRQVGAGEAHRLAHAEQRGGLLVVRPPHVHLPRRGRRAG